MVDKYIRDDQVAVLISHGFGAGWSTWADSKDAEKMLFDPDIVQAVLDKDWDKAMKLSEEKYPNAYNGGLLDICVYWMPIGTQFYIHEYDGAESIRELSDEKWYKA